MKTRQIPSMVWTTAFASVFLLGMSHDSVVKADDDHGQAPFFIEGGWRATVEVDSPPGIQAFDSVILFAAGGGLMESRRLYLVDFPGQTLLETPSAGNWRRVPGTDDTFDVTFMFLLQGAPGNSDLNGAPFGTDTIRWRATADRRTGELNGPWASEIQDLNGNVIFAASGQLTSAKIPIQPL
jgi:hypothetical protein